MNIAQSETDSSWAGLGRILGHVALMASFLFSTQVAASAQQIPALVDVPAAAAASHPGLVNRHTELQQERDSLHARVSALNARCAAVEEGSAAAPACLTDRSALQTELNAHIEKSKEFNTEVQAATESPITDPMVVDARHVPTGLPKSVESEIPDTPAGNRVRKGFESIMQGDWNAAHAWFQDALNHDQGNAGIRRLIELAEFTMQGERVPASKRKSKSNPGSNQAASNSLLDQGFDPALAGSIDEFNHDYAPQHPADPSVDSAPPGWKRFMDSLFSPPRLPRRPDSVGAVRD